jgi:hypothetical protein
MPLKRTDKSLALKGTGFSPYIKCRKMSLGFSPRGNHLSDWMRARSATKLVPHPSKRDNRSMAQRTHRILATVLLGICILSTAPAQQWRAMTFRGDAPGIDENPLRGFIPYSSTKQTTDTFPHSMEWFYLPLSAVAMGPDSYDWTALEKQLTAIAARGHQAIFRFYLDYPKKPSGIPAYLLAAGLKTFPYEDSGNAASPTPSVSPDYRDPRLIDCLVRFIHAFGVRYDGDVRIAYLTAGLYGFWGEWHVLDHPLPGEPSGWSITQNSKDALLQAYVESFHRTPVQVRVPDVTENRALLAHFGFHDDSFLQDTFGPQPWHFWAKMGHAGATNFWQAHPMGGEIYPELQSGLFESWPNRQGQPTSLSIAVTHATWMLDSALFVDPLTPAERANALRTERMLGYTFYCREWQLTQNKDGSSTIMVRLENRGAAPMYYAWPAEAEALDANGKIVAQTTASWPLPELLPGKTEQWSISFNSLPATANTILLRIADPMPGGHPLAFANAEMSITLPGWLTLNLAPPE